MDDNNEKYLLVSDSDELVQQLDSKKLSFSGLSDMVWDCLADKCLDMDQYITRNQYQTYLAMLDGQLELQQEKFGLVRGRSWNGRFKSVEGQVILIEAGEVDGIGKTPLQYVSEKWVLPSGCVFQQKRNCMLRGIVKSIEGQNTVKLAQNDSVQVGASNMPGHMHHSGITKGPSIKSLQVGSTNNATLTENSFTYDIFNNDSIAVGLDKNEMDGTVDEFDVQSSGDGDAVSHDNLPKYHEFYVFVVEKSA